MDKDKEDGGQSVCHGSEMLCQRKARSANKRAAGRVKVRCSFSFLLHPPISRFLFKILL